MKSQKLINYEFLNWEALYFIESFFPHYKTNLLGSIDFLLGIKNNS